MPNQQIHVATQDDHPTLHRGGIRFDATINLGHLLTFIGFIVAGATAWSTLDKRLLVVEEGRKVQEQIDRHQDTTTRLTMEQIRESLIEIKSQVGKLNEAHRTQR